MPPRISLIAPALLCALACPALAAEPGAITVSQPPAASAPAAADTPPVIPPPTPSTEKPWNFSAAITLYATPDQNVYVQPTIGADYGALHLEARYNYESLDTASLWAGYTFSGGEDFTIDFTPMVGVVFGDINGFAPGYELSLAWWKLELYTEGEYIISTEDKDENFFYSWTQFTIAPVENFQIGVAFQRTQAYDSGREVDVGPMIGFSFEKVQLSAWALNLDDDHPIYGVSLGIEF